MRSVIFVVFTLFTSNSVATNLHESLRSIESQWAQAYYNLPLEQQTRTYQRLLIQSDRLTKQFPSHAEPMILKAMILATNAGTQNPFDALFSIHKAKDLLDQAISSNPYAFEGAAFVLLGSLYYMVPGWPIAFGDDRKARALLQAALEINPDGIDANYFYGDFLLGQNRNQEAARFFKKAMHSPIRPDQAFGDKKLQNEARLALKNSSLRKVSGAKGLLMALFNSAQLD